MSGATVIVRHCYAEEKNVYSVTEKNDSEPFDKKGTESIWLFYSLATLVNQEYARLLCVWICSKV